ncbi:MAG: DNA mismatch repair endonuclease MutL [Chloroflexi bacterium]|nr:DNA mismatch repair endonuclease MutL [Chloroflexota bacterium]
MSRTIQKKINLLSPEVSSMIAAGEVIERPASVVKELVENSIDAGATEISVEIQGGGVELIRVADNGVGIPYDEVELAFQRFATSKLSVAEDLEAIATLGFRGEALPSIASVSQVTMVTRHADADSGARLEVLESQVKAKTPEGASPGTIITVQQLFRNVPARRKFLRSPGSESTRVQTLVTRYALAYPEIRFQLMAGRSRFASPGTGDLLEAVAAVYSLEVAQAMLEIDTLDEGDESGPQVTGVVGAPTVDRANRNYISLFVNRRWVQSRALNVAVEQAYHGFLKERRFPMAALNISMPFEDVDVNAHPAKSEVRFRSQDQVFSAVQHAVRQTLTAHTPVPEMRRAQVTAGGFSSAPARTATSFWPVQPFSRAAEAAGPTNGEVVAGISGNGPLYDGPLSPKSALPVLRVLGQVQSTYIAAEGPDGMYLIDQHAAHERVVFEKIQADAAAGAPEVQMLMEPATLELDARQQELLLDNQASFAALGLLVEPFGGDVFLIRGVPSILAEADPASALVDVLDEMSEGGDPETWQERAAYSIACHSAIRAGKVLTHQEMVELTRQLEACNQPHSCPHGRPTMIHLSATHLDREFGR